MESSMQNAIMIQGAVMSALSAILIGSSFGAIPAGTTGSETGEGSTTVQLAQAECQMFGPYATMGRANEVANMARGNGYSAIAFHNGDGYYVRIC
jgi:hypothetical protein